ncbi:MAG: hypothetical protein MZV65_54145 [Chromatiales bacterium]|nr:hypothetical protein [Chromatiales bacterium]
MLALFSGTAAAGELTAMTWDDKAAEPTLQVSVTGSPAYEVQTYEGGQRLRLVLSDTNLAGASDLEGVVQ